MEGKAGTGKAQIDRLMERASAALVATRYFEAERLALQALNKAHGAGGFEEMARIVLPLQEARRQKRQAAVEAGHREVIWSLRGRAGGEMRPGCYMIQPPLLGIDARNVREVADGMGVPTLVLAREPLTREGKWPVVMVAESVSVRTKVDPPWPASRVENSPTKDEFSGEASRPPEREWFEAAEEAMGDSAIAKLKPDEPAAWRVDDLMRFLDALPSHEKLHQRLEQECRAAMLEELPEERRHRPSMHDPFQF